MRFLQTIGPGSTKLGRKGRLKTGFWSVIFISRTFPCPSLSTNAAIAAQNLSKLSKPPRQTWPATIVKACTWSAFSPPLRFQADQARRLLWSLVRVPAELHGAACAVSDLPGQGGLPIPVPDLLAGAPKGTGAGWVGPFYPPGTVQPNCFPSMPLSFRRWKWTTRFTPLLPHKPWGVGGPHAGGFPACR
jgi:hypothetical protein